MRDNELSRSILRWKQFSRDIVLETVLLLVRPRSGSLQLVVSVPLRLGSCLRCCRAEGGHPVPNERHVGECVRIGAVIKEELKHAHCY